MPPREPESSGWTDAMTARVYLYNTATRSKELFTPEHDPVGMYCCGPTVYNHAHIGNLRTYLFEDVLKRALISAGYRVKHVVNITDVGHLVSDADTGEDKMEKGAAREGKSVWDIAAHYTKIFMENLADLNILLPDLFPRATDHLPQMIAMVQELERKGFTYRTADGIYFDTSKFPAYAGFARLEADSIRAGERVDMGDKKSPMDFALWKFSPSGVKRQMEWQSPWGVGFPGWHIECSAMALAYLKQPLEIHCGGTDHVRVHHTNEIAQTEAATGKPFARLWLHGEFLVVDKGKMAKSGDNFVTLEVAKSEGISPLAYRLFCFSAHYRSPLAFTWESLRASAAGLANLKKCFSVDGDQSKIDQQKIMNALAPFYDAVYDDLNMPRALAAVWDIARDASLTPGERAAAALKADEILGLDLLVPEQVVSSENFTGENGKPIVFISGEKLSVEQKQTIVSFVRERQKARSAKDFGRADVLRKELSGLGVAVKDLSDGSVEISS
ncbi:MAG: cysteine--tRNA ligase [Chitinispirillaceae bacterium]|jgi:cysteinyl-tRNA synthetase|nr:cysteine--tRNA ligase [Chitinispirillaceae bacterium]